MMPQTQASGDDRQGAGDPEGHREAVALRALRTCFVGRGARRSEVRMFSLDWKR